MSTRKRSRRVVEKNLANTQHIQLKVTKKKRTTHTDTDTVGADEQKIDLNIGTMNVEENVLATSSAERANNVSTEFDQNSNPANETDNDGSTDETDSILREADVLMAEIAEFRREMNANSSQNDSQATIIIGDTTDAGHSTNERNGSNDVATTSTQDAAVAGTSDSHTNNPIDDSVVCIDDTYNGAVRPIIKDDDEDVIFVTESRGSQRFRTIATIDLCNTPDNSFTTNTVQLTSVAAPAVVAPATPASNSTANELSPTRPGTTKCPICLESFGFDEICSTMCGHLYCDPCIKNAIKTRKKCPMCNRNLKANQVHRLFIGT